MKNKELTDYKDLRLKHLVLNYNGSLACDGMLLPGIKKELQEIAKKVQVHILFDDTYGDVQAQLEEIPSEVFRLFLDKEDEKKLHYIMSLGLESTICIGNGRSDRLIIEKAKIGFVVIGKEGAAFEAIRAADEIFTNTISALKYLNNVLNNSESVIS